MIRLAAFGDAVKLVPDDADANLGLKLAQIARTTAAVQPHHGTALALSRMNRAGLASQLIIVA